MKHLSKKTLKPKAATDTGAATQKQIQRASEKIDAVVNELMGDEGLPVLSVLVALNATNAAFLQIGLGSEIAAQRLRAAAYTIEGSEHDKAVKLALAKPQGQA